MKIRDKHRVHGAALAQIVEYPKFKALNEAGDDKYGHYEINNNIRILIKSTKEESAPWEFTFNDNELLTLRRDIEQSYNTCACLVCGDFTVCAINSSEILQLLDLKESVSQKVIVDMPPGGSLWVRSGKRKLKRSIPHNSFPKKVFS